MFTKRSIHYRGRLDEAGTGRGPQTARLSVPRVRRQTIGTAFPDDHDPCDHELVWVRYDPATEAVVGFWTYFQGRILSSEAAVSAANAAGGRVRVNVQWGNPTRSW